MTDPQAPDAGADVLVSGSERVVWHPSRRQTLISLALAVLLGAGVVATDKVQAARHERALDRAALAAVSVTVGEDSTRYFDIYGQSGDLSVVNAGPVEVHLESATLDVPGVTVSQRDLLLLPNTPVALGVTDERACSLTGLDAPLASVVLHLRTTRGDRTTRTLALPPPPSAALRDRYAERCALFRPIEALRAEVTRMAPLRRGLRATLRLSNGGVLPMTVERWDATAGLEVKGPPTPFALPPAEAPFETGAAVDVTLTVTVTDCRALQETPFDIEGAQLGVLAVAHNPRETADVRLPLSPPERSVGPSLNGFARLLSLCNLANRG